MFAGLFWMPLPVLLINNGAPYTDQVTCSVKASVGTLHCMLSVVKNMRRFRWDVSGGAGQSPKTPGMHRKTHAHKL